MLETHLPYKNKVSILKAIILYFFIPIFLINSTSCKTNKEIVSKKQEVENGKEKIRLEFKYMFSEALKNKMLGNNDLCMAYLSKCLELDNENPAAMYELAQMLIKLNDYNAAIILMEKATDIEPNNHWYKQLYGYLLYTTGQYEKAIKIFKTTLETEAFNETTGLLYAEVLLLAEKQSDAIEIYNILQSKYGTSKNIMLAKRKVYSQMKQLQKYETELLNLCTTYPDVLEYKLLLADHYISQSNWEKVEKIFAEANVQHPYEGELFMLESDYYLLRNKNKEAAEKLMEAINTNLSYSEKYNQTVNFIYSNVLSSENITLFTQLLKTLCQKHPEQGSANFLLAETYINSENIADAATELRTGLTKYPSNYAAWEQLCLVDYQLNDFNNLLTDSKNAIELFPNKPMIFLYNGIANSNLHNYNDAIETLSYGNSIVINDDNLKAQFYVFLGEAYARVKNYEKSDTCFENLLEIDPDNIFVLNNYSYYLAMRGVNLERAKSLINSALMNDPYNHTFLDTYAWVLYKMQNYTEAKIMIEKSIENGGNKSAVIIEHYGDILFKLNNKAEAVKQWKKAKEIGTGSEFLDEKIKTETLKE